MTDPDTATGSESESENEPRASQHASPEQADGAAQADDQAAEQAEQADDDYEPALAGLHKMSAPHTFAADVEETIRRRSGGRFFGRKAFGDRVPFEVLAIVVLVIGLAVFFLLRSSQTGSLRYEKQPETPEIAPGARDVMPQLRPVDK